MTQKEMTKHLRSRIKAAGIQARVRMCGNAIQVITPTYESRWTEEEQREINLIAQVNGLTLVRGMPVTLDKPISTQADFYMGV